MYKLINVTPSKDKEKFLFLGLGLRAVPKCNGLSTLEEMWLELDQYQNCFRSAIGNQLRFIEDR